MENDDDPLFMGFAGTTRYPNFGQISFIQFQHNTGSMMDGAEALCGNVALQTNVDLDWVYWKVLDFEHAHRCFQKQPL